jgi:hypothetical protein
VPRRAANTAPKSATPTEPPSERNRFADAVAMPRSRRSTAFWIATVRTCVTRPKPTPKRASSTPAVATEVPVPIRDSASRPAAIRARPATGNAL